MTALFPSSVGTGLTRCDDTLTTEVYRKPTDTGLLLHFQSHVDSRYKKGLINTMVNRAYRLSSTKAEGFVKECNKLPTMFSKLHYPKRLVDSNIIKFSQEPDKEIHPLPSADPSVYIVLPFKDQRSADRVRRDIYSLGAKIDVNVNSIFTSKTLSNPECQGKEDPIVNTQCVVYLFQCDLCDANYFGYTARHFHQRIGEHRYSGIGKHLETQLGNNRRKIDHLFKVLRKCKSKFDCLVLRDVVHKGHQALS